MRTYPYLRAYLAGIAVPTVFLLVLLTAYTIARYGYAVSLPIERVIVFPMAVVPNLWGAWNIVHLRLKRHVAIPLGVHGALLPFVLVPFGVLLTRLLDVPLPSGIGSSLRVAMPVVIVAYYLIWKHFVGFLNNLLGIGGPGPN